MTFNQKVWYLISKVPRGKVTTYKEIAKALNTKAYRAVGNACNKNPYSPRVPCHRVVASSGHLHGFAHGLKRKAQLLRNEGVEIENYKVVNFQSKIFHFR